MATNGVREDALGGGCRQTRWLINLVVVLVAPTLTLGCQNERASEPVRDGTDQRISHAGVSVSVPSSWTKNNVRCGVPVSDTYIVDLREVTTCAVSPEPRVNYVWIRTPEVPGVDPAEAEAISSGSVDGKTVRVGTTTLADGRTRRTIVVPDRRVVLVIVLSDSGSVEAMTDSVRIS